MRNDTLTPMITYYSHDNNYKIILHSVDITDNRERIIIVTDYLGGKKNKRIANITYMDRSVIFPLLS